MDDQEPRQVTEPRYDAFAVLRMALDVLGQRTYKWVCLLMTFAVFAGALYRPSWVRFAIAGGFTVSVYLLTTLLERGNRR